MTTGSTAAPAITMTSKADGPAKWFFGGETWMPATSAATGGLFSIIEQIGAPGIGSPYHLHHNEDESFYIIEGSIRFVSGDESFVAGPGSWVFLPRNQAHGFEVVGDEIARFLIQVTPGGFDGFVRELWEDDVPAGPPDMARVMETAGRYGLEILGPLPD